MNQFAALPVVVVGIKSVRIRSVAKMLGLSLFAALAFALHTGDNDTDGTVGGGQKKKRKHRFWRWPWLGRRDDTGARNTLYHLRLEVQVRNLVNSHPGVDIYMLVCRLF